MLSASAALALGALATPAASATESEFLSGASPTEVISSSDGSGKTAHHVIDIAGGALTCPGIELKATLEGFQTPEFTTSLVKYTGSCIFLGQAATVSMNGCNYDFHGTGTIDIVCPAGKEIEVSVLACEVLIPAQSGLGSVSFTNISSDTEITTSFSIGGISHTAAGGGCLETGALSNGSYTTGNTILSGKEGGGEAVPIGWQKIPPPAVGVSPVGGGAKLDFKGKLKGDTKEVKVTNSPSGPNVPAELGTRRIEVGGKQEETHFTIIAGGTCQAGEVLNRGESCTVLVEFRSGTAGKTATFAQNYGNRFVPNALTATLAIES
jgi:hypothetical protein